MQVRLTLTTDVQQPWPAMVFSRLQDALRSRTKAVQEVQIVTSLEQWQVKQLEVREFVDNFCKSLRSDHGMACYDVKCEVIEDGDSAD